MNELNFLTPEARQRLLDRGFDFMRRAVSLGTNGEFVSCTGKPLTDVFVLTHSVPAEIQAVLSNALHLLFERVDLVPETFFPETAETGGHPSPDEVVCPSFAATFVTLPSDTRDFVADDTDHGNLGS